MARTSVGSMRPGWERLDELLDRYMMPAMIEAGFTRVGWTCVVESPDENVVSVDVRGQTSIPMLSFFIEWVAIPRALREFHAERRAPGSEPKWGLAQGRLESPPDVRHIREMKHDWRLDPSRDFDSFGRLFEQALRSEAIPMWLQLLDRDYLAQRKGYGYYDDAPGLRHAILYVDDGDPEQVSRWLREASESRAHTDDTIVDWLKQRVARRRSP